MSVTRLHSISMRYFKAFGEFQLNLDGRHLLAYGANGSGKSSLYWALYTFLESSGKTTDQVKKYFEPANSQSLVNIHVPAPENENAFVKLTLAGDSANTYEISAYEHQTKDVPVIAKANLASDFITYRFIFKFSDFRNSQVFDFWALFEREILPFCRTTSGADVNAEWKAICTNLPHERDLRGGAVTKAYDEIDEKINSFNVNLSTIIEAIATKAKEFFAEHFADEAVASIELALGITSPANYDRKDKKLISPKLQLGVKVDGKEIKRPHVFLNEATLTQIAISIRFAASLVNLHDSPIKLLVVDDLLVSLDLSNRMKVVEVLLSEKFGNYQKVILTHDLGFFREFRRMIGADHTQWCFKSFSGNPKVGITINEQKSSIEKAEGYINNFDLEEAAICLRKAAEESVQRFRRVALKEIRPPGEFHSLTEDLRAARNNLRAQIPIHIYEKVLRSVPDEHREKLVRVTDDDLDADASLDAATRGILKCQRRKMSSFLNESGWANLQTIEIIDSILKMTDRVLNPANHWGESAVYQAELQKALRLIGRLERCVLTT